jgi:carbonic anhydrase/acetyltransferase-like protein (isoleucine patch superfamily)/acyl-coenzyme A thioesterase PaaI-like protein
MIYLRAMNDEARYREQHKRRLSFMPWLYFSLKPHHRSWAEQWQAEVQRELSELETVRIEPGCFVAPEARIFAEPGRDVVIGAGSSIAADAFLHGPIELGKNVSLNARVTIDGGRAGVSIGDDTRIASGAAIYAFDHGLSPSEPIREQRVRSLGVRIGKDVWVGANAGITDGVTIGDHAVVAMGAVVIKDVPDWAIVGGIPARVLGDRRTWPGASPVVLSSVPMHEESLQDRFAARGTCFGCGPANEKGLRIKSRVEGETVVARWTPEPHHEAFEGVLSGGIIGTLLDCHSNWTAAHHLMVASNAESPPCTVTAEYAVKLLRPAPARSGPVSLRAKVVESKGDRAVVEAELEAGGKICATCRGTFVAVKPGHPAYHRW